MSSYGHLMLNRYDVEIDTPNATPKTLAAFKHKAAIAYVERIMRDIYDTPIPATNAHKANEDGSLLAISNLVINSNRHGHARISHEMSVTGSLLRVGSLHFPTRDDTHGQPEKYPVPCIEMSRGFLIYGGHTLNEGLGLDASMP